MSNSIFELVESHCSIFDTNLQNVKSKSRTGKTMHGIFQLDFLAWYVDSDKIDAYGVPGIIDGVRDNPNWIPTEFENVYLMSEFHGENVSIDYQLVIPEKAPVKIMNRRYFKVRSGNKYVYKWRISIYGKALKLYYMGYFPRLKKYISKYSGECSRADLCWDFPSDLPDGIIDLPLTGTNHSTRYFGEKNSPIFFRIYDKTKDLKREKNCMAWFYPEWYKDECWRLECQLTGRYSRSMSPLDWLDICKVDKSKIQKFDAPNRNVYKTALCSVINTVDWISLSNQDKLDILNKGKSIIDSKIDKLTRDVL